MPKSKSKAKLIQFAVAKPEFEGIFDPPEPAAKFLPEWYKNQCGYTENNQKSILDGNYNHTVKQCMPALDAMTAGYIIPLPQDVAFQSNEAGAIDASWPVDVFEQVSSHSLEQISQYPLDQDVWEAAAMKFNNPWIIKTPPGYSTLFCHPMWHDDLPFRCFSGFVDTDTYNVNSVNFPFLLRRGFRGVIPGGTPMIHVIPIKRSAWKSEVLDKADPDNYNRWQRSRRSFGHRYKRDFRQNKEYK